MIELQSDDNALRIYNRLYNNNQYHHIGELVASDLKVDRENSRVSMLMNPVTDAALMLCGHSRYTESWISLAIICANSNLSHTTIDAICDYLMLYQQHNQDVRTGDFASTAKALLKVYQATEVLQATATCASDIHSWQARMAYHLLYAAEFLTIAASLLLKQEDNSYTTEKIQYALNRLIKASHEGLWHSKQAHLYDFSHVRLPKAN